MGYGSYTAHDWAKLRASRKLDSSSTNQIFTKCDMDKRFDPGLFDKREARDSDEHPDSTPIIIGVDVTGSMGYLSTKIIKESLNELMQNLYFSKPINDPQLLFAAIGDASCDSAPLQVTQFESDIRIAEQLMDLWLENRGGDAPEDYPLLWYFADKHTDIDSFNKRGKKGFCFSIGDADCHPTISASDLRRIFADDVPHDMSIEELAEMGSRKYELFHIMIGEKPNKFTRVIPGRIIYITQSDIDYLPDIIISTIMLSLGMDKDEVLNKTNSLAKSVVKNVINRLCINNKTTIEF
ncbi:MAG: hypothetical protein IJO09_05060 [Oscillospiraceae bacterium]|nr:hypothetical protein [Oscillospiraceae bacterium]